MHCSLIPAGLVFGRAIYNNQHERLLGPGTAGKPGNPFPDEAAVWPDILPLAGEELASPPF